MDLEQQWQRQDWQQLSTHLVIIKDEDDPKTLWNQVLCELAQYMMKKGRKLCPQMFGWYFSHCQSDDEHRHLPHDSAEYCLKRKTPPSSNLYRKWILDTLHDSDLSRLSWLWQQKAFQNSLLQWQKKQLNWCEYWCACGIIAGNMEWVKWWFSQQLVRVDHENYYFFYLAAVYNHLPLMEWVWSDLQSHTESRFQQDMCKRCLWKAAERGSFETVKWLYPHIGREWGHEDRLKAIADQKHIHILQWLWERIPSCELPMVALVGTVEEKIQLLKSLEPFLLPYARDVTCYHANDIEVTQWMWQNRWISTDVLVAVYRRENPANQKRMRRWKPWLPVMAAFHHMYRSYYLSYNPYNLE